jgi:lipid-binding SYLF domain-containing protein
MRPIASAFCGTLLMLFAASALADSREEAKLMEAKAILTEWQAMPDQMIPERLLERAQGIAVFPAVVKAALFFGGKGGSGVLVVRDAAGRWSSPSFVRVGGGSWGLQFGVETADVILVFTTRKSVEGLTGGKLTLGGDASAAIGPVGRDFTGATDVGLAEIYSYSRAKGLFAGIAISGSAITIDHNANARFYQRAGILASEIFAMDASQGPEPARPFVTEVARLTVAPSPATAPPAALGVTPGGAPTATPAESKGLESGGAATFPLDPPKR